MDERFVAFIDILGFKQIVEQLECDHPCGGLSLNRIRSVLNFMDEETYEPNYSADLPVYVETEAGVIETELGDPRLTYISDCIIISAEPTLDGFKGLSRKIHKITADLAFDGVFCRGAISKGKLYHESRMIFGSSYIRAYQLESQAKYPRVIIDPDILECFDLGGGKVPLAPAFYGKDSDGYYYQRYWTWFLFPPYAGGWFEYLKVVRGHLIRNASKYRDDAHLYEKYSWLINEFNSLIVWWSELFDDIPVNVISL